MTTAALGEKNISLGLADNVRSLVPYDHGTWQQAGRHGAGEGADSLTSEGNTGSHWPDLSL